MVCTHDLLGVYELMRVHVMLPSFALLASATFLIGCNGGGSGSGTVTPTPPITVALNNTTPTLDAGSQISFTAGVANDSSRHQWPHHLQLKLKDEPHHLALR
jgi:hypothetical protein